MLSALQFLNRDRDGEYGAAVLGADLDGAVELFLQKVLHDGESQPAVDRAGGVIDLAGKAGGEDLFQPLRRDTAAVKDISFTADVYKRQVPAAQAGYRRSRPPR